MAKFIKGKKFLWYQIQGVKKIPCKRISKHKIKTNQHIFCNFKNRYQFIFNNSTAEKEDVSYYRLQFSMIQKKCLNIWIKI